MAYSVKLGYLKLSKEDFFLRVLIYLFKLILFTFHMT